VTHYRTTKYFADEGDELAAKLQRVAAQGTDGSVRVEEPRRSISNPPKITWIEVYEPAHTQDLSTTNPPKPPSIQHIRLSYQFLPTSYN
jgi:hypothetical protein